MALDQNGFRIDDTSSSARFSVLNQATLDEGIAHLNEYGYTVFRDVTELNEVEENKKLLWQFLESIPAPYNRIRRDRPCTWNYWPGIRSRGIINTYGMGQSAFIWSIRSNRQVQRVYERVWNRSDLLVSLEGCGIQWRATRGQLMAIATPEKHINSIYIVLMEKLCLSKELLDENELRDLSQHYSISYDD